MRTVTPAWREQIKVFEGFRSYAYRCPAGVWTIGYGFTKGVKPRDFMTREEADIRLLHELQRYELGVAQLCPGSGNGLSDGEFDALVDFAYNLGLGNLQASTLRRKVNRGAPDEEVVDEFAKWVRAGGKVVSGLVTRRLFDAHRYLAAA